jgi:hypothetical protein
MLVISKLIGGLGNQLFQYATGRALAHRLGSSLALETAELLDHRNTAITPRHYELGVFPALAAAPVALAVSAAMHQYRTRPLFRAVNKARKALGHRPAYVELGEGGAFNFNATVAEYHTPAGLIYLDGYWQNERYFESIAPLLRQELVLPIFADVSNQQVSKQIVGAGVHAVSVHVRRGDYLQFEGHGLCSVDYYVRALDTIAEVVAEPIFFVFSDDIDWVRANIPLPATATFIYWNQGPASYHDLHLMSQCRHHIIANSSFSWWGAWLNPHTDKHVISPRNWMGNPTVTADRVVPTSWRKL